MHPQSMQFRWCPIKNDSLDIEAERDCSSYQAMTNADRIRNMTDEELAKFIKAVGCNSHYGDDCGYPFCHSMKGKLCTGIAKKTDKKTLKWLQSQVEV